MKNKNWRNEEGGDLAAAAAYQKRCHKYIESERKKVEPEKKQRK